MKHFIVSLILLFAITSFSQDYLPMLEDGNAWGSKSYHISESTVYYQFEIGEEVEFNNILYNRIYLNNQATNCYIREEGGVIYHRNLSNTEKVLFDFTLEVGDTFEKDPITCFTGDYGSTTVLSINNQFIAGENRKVLEMSGLGNDFWIEGIGSTSGGLFGGLNWIEGGASLICFINNGETYFFNNETECNIVLSNNDYSINEIILYPNPISERSILQLPYEAEVDQLKIYNISGRLIKDIRITSDKFILNNMDYASGLYFYQVSSNGVPVKTEKFIVK